MLAHYQPLFLSPNPSFIAPSLLPLRRFSPSAFRLESRRLSFSPPIPYPWMGENPSPNGWVNPRLPLTPISTTELNEDLILEDPNPTAEGWVNPRRPLTAMKLTSGGVAGDVGLPSISARIAERRRQRLCCPPVAADPPSDLSIVGDGLAGSSEEESSLSWASLPAHMMAANPERWAQAVAETEAWMKEMERVGFF